MKHTSVACIGALLAIEAFAATTASAASARSSRPEAMTTGDSATIVSDLEIHGFIGERGHAGLELVRPHYGAPECTTDGGPECTTDDGLGYAWPCSRPGRNY